jgi:hypothetical protein
MAQGLEGEMPRKTPLELNPSAFFGALPYLATGLNPHGYSIHAPFSQNVRPGSLMRTVCW